MSQNRVDKLGEFVPSPGQPATIANDYCGASTMVMSMLANKAHVDVYDEVLQVGIALLDGGNKQVQKRMYKFMTKDNTKFFKRIRDQLRNSMSAMQEHHDNVIRLVGYVHPFFPASSSLHIGMTTDLFNVCSESETPQHLKLLDEMLNESYVEELLRFIQLTCEGHNLDIQNYWREQKSSQTFNIVNEVYISFTFSVFFLYHYIALKFIQGNCLPFIRSFI
jgi:inositol 1,4,5-triphosphate receptor type 1